MHRTLDVHEFQAHVLWRRSSGKRLGHAHLSSSAVTQQELYNVKKTQLLNLPRVPGSTDIDELLNLHHPGLYLGRVVPETLSEAADEMT